MKYCTGPLQRHEIAFQSHFSGLTTFRDNYNQFFTTSLNTAKTLSVRNNWKKNRNGEKAADDPRTLGPDEQQCGGGFLLFCFIC